VLLWFVDCFTPEVPDWIVPLVARVDAFLTTAKGMVSAYAALAETPVFWVPEGAYLPAFPNIEVETARRPLYASQVAFLGNIFQPPVPDQRIALRRLRLLSRIGERYTLKLWGPQSPDFDRYTGPLPFRVLRWPAYNDECVRVCRSADIVLGMNTVDSVDCYFSDRTFMTLASGGFHLTSYVPGLEAMFENHEHLVWFRSDDECLELIEHYLDRPDDRDRIAASGRRFVRERYPMDAQVDKVLRIVETHDGRTRDR
jgi:spore maturation protein CgeB